MFSRSQVPSRDLRDAELGHKALGLRALTDTGCTQKKEPARAESCKSSAGAGECVAESMINVDTSYQLLRPRDAHHSWERSRRSDLHHELRFDLLHRIHRDVPTTINSEVPPK